MPSRSCSPSLTRMLRSVLLWCATLALLAVSVSASEPSAENASSVIISATPTPSLTSTKCSADPIRQAIIDHADVVAACKNASNGTLSLTDLDLATTLSAKQSMCVDSCQDAMKAIASTWGLIDCPEPTAYDLLSTVGNIVGPFNRKCNAPTDGSAQSGKLDRPYIETVTAPKNSDLVAQCAKKSQFNFNDATSFDMSKAIGFCASSECITVIDLLMYAYLQNEVREKGTDLSRREVYTYFFKPVIESCYSKKQTLQPLKYITLGDMIGGQAAENLNPTPAPAPPTPTSPTPTSPKPMSPKPTSPKPTSPKPTSPKPTHPVENVDADSKSSTPPPPSRTTTTPTTPTASSRPGRASTTPGKGNHGEERQAPSNGGDEEDNRSGHEQGDSAQDPGKGASSPTHAGSDGDITQTPTKAPESKDGQDSAVLPVGGGPDGGLTARSGINIVPSTTKQASGSSSSASDGETSQTVSAQRSGGAALRIFGSLLMVLAAIVVVVLLVSRWKSQQQAHDADRLKGLDSLHDTSDSGFTLTNTDSSSATPHSAYHPASDLPTTFISTGSQLKSSGSSCSASAGMSLWDDEELQSLYIPVDSIEDVRLIGCGGYGVVYLVKQRVARNNSDSESSRRDSRLLASKRLVKSQLTREKTRAFINEIKLVAKLQHPSVVALAGVAWTNESDLQALFEYMAGGDLRSHLDATPVDSWPWNASKLQVALDIADALAYVHAQTINGAALVHRDLKSRNVLLTSSRSSSLSTSSSSTQRALRAKLSDFGVSRFESAQQSMTTGVGTSRWLAPEVIIGGGQYDASCDVYAFGVLLSELDTHCIPFSEVCGAQGHALPDVMILQLVSTQRLQPRFASVSSGDDVGARVASLARQCLSFERRERPNALEVASQLRMLIATIGSCD